MPESSSANTQDRIYFNSAKRLCDTLIQLKRMNGRNGFEVLPKFFGFAPERTPNDPWPVIQSIGIFGEMIENFKREVAETGVSSDVQELYCECLTGILQALSPNGYARHWADIAAEIKDVDLNGLKHVEAALRLYVSERKIEDAEFEPLRGAIQEALKVLDDTELPLELRRFVSSQLAAVATSIAEYRFRGADGMREAIAGYVGSLSMYQEELKKLPEIEKNRLRRVVGTMKDLLALGKCLQSAWPYINAGAAHLLQLLH